MKRWIGLALLVFVGAAGWRTGGELSPDALSMATGVLFGVMAGVPAALLVMAGSRRRDREEREEREANRTRQQQIQPMQQGWAAPYAQQPPIIVVAGPQGLGTQTFPPLQPHAGWLPQEPPTRQFTVVGNGEEFVEEW